MKKETISNFAWMCFWLVLALVCSITMFLNWVHLIFAIASYAFAWIMYNDNEYGVESVKEYFERRRKEGK